MTVDVLVVGAGFSGAITAMALARQGKRVALVERGTHPRFAIGESSTPLANLLLEDLADRYGLDRLRPFSKWGTWQRERPEVGCGLKRGFSFFFHVDGQSFQDTEQHRRQLLVAASPHDEIADTHWYRPDFDAALVRDAQDLGVEYLDSAALDAPAWHGDTVRVEGHRQGSPLTFQADFLIDASGPRGYLAQAMGLPSRRLPWLPQIGRAHV